jgi:hypothetical protein
VSNEEGTDLWYEDVEKWTEGFDSSGAVKALKAAFSTFSFLDGAHKFRKELLFPEPNCEELILAALDELRGLFSPRYGLVSRLPLDSAEL